MLLESNLNEVKEGKRISAKGYAINHKNDTFKPFIFSRHSLGDNDILIETIQNQINSNKDMDIEKKEILLDTIQDLEYQKETNVQIVKILDELRYDKEAEDAKRNAKNNDVLK